MVRGIQYVRVVVSHPPYPCDYAWLFEKKPCTNKKIASLQNIPSTISLLVKVHIWGKKAQLSRKTRSIEIGERLQAIAVSCADGRSLPTPWSAMPHRRHVNTIQTSRKDCMLSYTAHAVRIDSAQTRQHEPLTGCSHRRQNWNLNCIAEEKHLLQKRCHFFPDARFFFLEKVFFLGCKERR